MNNYISLAKAAKKYDFHTDTIKKHMKNMEEGVHYYYCLGKIRFDEEKLHNYLTNTNRTNATPNNYEHIIDRFLLENC